MFHIGKVIEVLHPDEKGSKSADMAMHALVEMWDANLIIFKVNPALAREIKDGTYVLVDYSPVAVGGAPVPKHEVCAIVTETKGKKIIAKLKQAREEKKPRNPPSGEPEFFVPGKMIG